MTDHIGNDNGTKQGMADDELIYTKTGIEQAGDIVTRLQEQSQAPALAWLEDAADEIERLQAEVDELTALVRTQQTGRALLSLEKERELCDLLATMLDHQANDHLHPNWVDAKNLVMKRYKESRENDGNRIRP